MILRMYVSPFDCTFLYDDSSYVSVVQKLFEILTASN